MGRIPSHLLLVVALCAVVLTSDALRDVAHQGDRAGNGARMAMLSVGTCCCIGILVWAHRRRLTTALEGLEQSVVRLGQGELASEVAEPAAEETRALATALESARARLLKHTDALVHTKQLLTEELGQARAELADPVAGLRQERLARLGGTAQVQMGRVSGEGRLRDLWLDHAVIELDRSLWDQLVVGQPVSIVVRTPGGTEVSGEGVAVRRAGGRWAWAFDWRSPLSPAELPDKLWEAINPRRALRVQPPATDRLRGVLDVQGRTHSAEVIDLSQEGAAVSVATPLERLGMLGGEAGARLTLELPGEHVVQLSVDVRSIVVRSHGTRLGLAFTDLRDDSLRILVEYLNSVAEPASDEEHSKVPLASEG
ncbi:MAG: PilZ domain-containing protein [Myxococcales bacterium]|nr:PilZ domain-containing protein [Myxococcales bacterium]